ncbi:hypothetical protein [Variovorax sp. RCC_210]|uniref:hypothetical protein n=1 Tax=Variovorax sp. RCC_210 TaxID=3239217 RepID=UPI0035259E5A
MRQLQHCWLCALAILGTWSAASATAETVPNDRLIVRGPQTYEARIGNCAIEIPLSRGEYFWTSSSFNDAVFYTPAGPLKKSSSPFLHKPNVESYSDLAWKYIKPRSTGERWFGLMCAPGALSNKSSLVEVNCPSRRTDGKWMLENGYGGLYAPPIALNGKNWTGFAVISKSDRKPRSERLFDIKFCLFGEQQTIMGQSQFTSHTNFLELLKKIQAMTLLLRKNP